MSAKKTKGGLAYPLLGVLLLAGVYVIGRYRHSHPDPIALPVVNQNGLPLIHGMETQGRFKLDLKRSEFNETLGNAGITVEMWPTPGGFNIPEIKNQNEPSGYQANFLWERNLNSNLRAEVRCYDSRGRQLGNAGRLWVLVDPNQRNFVHLAFPLIYPPQTQMLSVSIGETAHSDGKAVWTFAAPAVVPTLSSTALSADKMTFGMATLEAAAAERPSLVWAPTLRLTGMEAAEGELASAIGATPDTGGFPITECLVRLITHDPAARWVFLPTACKAQWSHLSLAPSTHQMAGLPSSGNSQSVLLSCGAAFPGTQHIVKVEGDLRRIVKAPQRCVFHDADIKYSPDTDSYQLTWSSVQTKRSAIGRIVTPLNGRRSVKRISSPIATVPVYFYLAIRPPDATTGAEYLAPWPTAATAPELSSGTLMVGRVMSMGDIWIYIPGGWGDVRMPGLPDPVGKASPGYFQSQLRPLMDGGRSESHLYEILVPEAKLSHKGMHIKTLTLEFPDEVIAEQHHVVLTLPVRPKFDPAMSAAASSLEWPPKAGYGGVGRTVIRNTATRAGFPGLNSGAFSPRRPAPSTHVVPGSSPTVR